MPNKYLTIDYIALHSTKIIFNHYSLRQVQINITAIHRYVKVVYLYERRLLRKDFNAGKEKKVEY